MGLFYFLLKKLNISLIITVEGGCIMILLVSDIFSNYLEMINMNDMFSKLFIFFVMIVILNLILSKIRTSTVMMIVMNSFYLILTTTIGLVPIWVIIAVVMSVLAYAIMVIMDIPLRGGVDR